MSGSTRGSAALLLAACVALLGTSAARCDDLADALATAGELRVAIEAAKAQAEQVYATESRRIHAEHAESMAEAEAMLRAEHGANGDPRGEFESAEAYRTRMDAYRQGLEAFGKAWRGSRAAIEQARDDALAEAREAWERPADVEQLAAELQAVENTVYRVEVATKIAPYRPEDQTFHMRLSHDTWPVPPDAIAFVPVAEAEDARPRLGAVTVEYGIEDGKEALRGMWVGEGDQYAAYAAEWTRIRRLEGYVGPTTGGVFLGHRRAVTAGADGRLVLWNTEIGEPVRDIDAHAGKIEFLIRSARHVVSASERDIRLWDARTLAPFMTIGNLQLLPQPLPDAPPRRQNWRQVSAVAINGASGRLAYAVRSPAPRIQLWDADGEVREKGIEGLPAMVTSLAFSHSGEFLAAGMSHGGVVLWRLRELTSYARDRQRDPKIKARRSREDWVDRPPTEALALGAHKKAITALAFTGDGSQFVTASEDKTAKLWDVESGEQLLRFVRGHSDAITSVAVRDKTRRLITGSLDGSARMWNLGTGESIRRYRGHEGPVRSVTVGRGLLTTSEDGSARLWHVGTGWEQRALRGHKRASWLVDLTDDGERLLTVGAGASIKLWDLESGVAIPGAWEDQSGSGSAAMTSDGRLIARGDAGSTLNVWDTRDPSAARSVPVGGLVRSLRFVADDKWLLVEADGKPVERRNIDALEDRRPLLPEPDRPARPDYGRNYTLSGNDQRMCTQTDDGELQMWDMTTSRLGLKWSAGVSLVMWLRLNHDGSRLLTGQVEGTGPNRPSTVRMWDTRSGKMLRELRQATHGRLFAQFSPDGGVAMTYPFEPTVDPAGEVTLWSAETGQALRTLDPPPGGSCSVTFSGDGARVAVAAGGAARLYETATGREVARIHVTATGREAGRHRAQYNGSPTVAWSADGTTIVFSSRKGVIDVWRPLGTGAGFASVE